MGGAGTFTIPFGKILSTKAGQFAFDTERIIISASADSTISLVQNKVDDLTGGILDTDEIIVGVHECVVDEDILADLPFFTTNIFDMKGWGDAAATLTFTFYGSFRKVTDAEAAALNNREIAKANFDFNVPTLLEWKGDETPS